MAAILEELLRRHPELRAEVERIACERLATTDEEAVADEIESELGCLAINELNGRAGRQRGGYVEPTDAAWELLEEAVAAYDHEVDRLVELGMIEAATATALGVISGLYRCRDCADGELLLSWAPDFPLEHASGVVRDLAKAGVEFPHELLAAAAPEWVNPLASATRDRR
ncbi:MAG: hypothetical protein ACYCR4_10205 [Acidimicrobiales bacterium]